MNTTIKKIWKRIKENISFLAVLIATLLALLLMVGLSFGTFYGSAREDAITIGKMTVSQEARRIEDALMSGMNTLLVSSYTVDSMLLEGAAPQEIEDYLVRETRGIITGINPNFSGIYGVIKDVYVDGIGWQPEEGYDPYERPWYTAAALKKGELAIVSPYIDAQTKSIMLSFSKILCDGKSAISLDTQLDNVYEVTESIQLNGSGYCFLVDKQGQVIAHRDQSQVGRNYITDSSSDVSEIRPVIQRVCDGTDDNTFQNITIDSSDCMVFTHSVQGEWNVVLVVSSSDLFKEIRNSLTQSILVSVVIFVIVGYFSTSNYLNKKRALRYAEDVRTDDLTGLNNRGEFDRYLSVATNNLCPEKKLYLLLFDADDFKFVNDTFGHQEGDRALRLMSNALKSVCHGTDWFCARYGGDEFVIICRCDSEIDVRSVIDRLNGKLVDIAAAECLPYRLSFSCGYACYDPESQSLSDLVVAADQMLYQVKTAKKHA